MQAYRWMADSRVRAPVPLHQAAADNLGFLRSRPKGEDAELDVSIPMPHDLQRESSIAIVAVPEGTPLINSAPRPAPRVSTPLLPSLR